MTQRDRDRLVVLKKVVKKLIKQVQAAKELNLSARQIRRLLRGMKEKRGQDSNPQAAGGDPRIEKSARHSGRRSSAF